MRRIKDEYLEIITSRIPLNGKELLEIGCAEGRCSVLLSQAGARVTGIDPDQDAVHLAAETYPHIRFLTATADNLPFVQHQFDIVLFTLSFHHVIPKKMFAAIDEAIRVVKPDGLIIFLEPAFIGSFFEAELLFNACDGDERREKTMAFVAMHSHPLLQEIAECFDETLFSFDSVSDFVASMQPRRTNLDLETFLEKNDFVLSAQRRISFFKTKTLL